MAATIFLVRHATTASTGRKLGGRTETPLDERGQGQAEATAQRLAEVPLKAVYASPLARTMQTAAAVAAPHRLEVVADPGLLEVDYGRWTDRALAPLTRTTIWPVIQQRPSLVTFPQGESIRGAQLRAVDALEVIAARHDRRAVAVVSHADVIKALVAFYAGMPLDHFQRIACDPASVTVIALGRGSRPFVIRTNDTGPWDPKALAAPRRHTKASAGPAATPATASARKAG